MEKELDLKQQVLVGFYLEYQKEIPDMQNISAELLGTDEQRFIIAVKKLENEGFIQGAKFVEIDQSVNPIHVRTDWIMLTNYGLSYVEEVLEIKPTMSAGEKVKDTMGKVASWGYSELKDIGVKVLSEVVSNIVKG